MRVFYFVLFLLRYFLLLCFVLITICFFPIIALAWCIYGKEMFEYLNEVCTQIGKIAEKKIKEAKYKL